MNFKRTLLGLAIISALNGCGWEEKYSVVDCSADADPTVVDCRSDSAVVDTVDGGSEVEDDSGNIVSFERDESLLQSLTETASTSWSPSHSDQIDLLVTAADDQVFVGSKFHNYLQSFQSDVVGQLTSLDATAFLDVSGDRYEVDAFTGASEQVFNHLNLDASDTQTLLIAQAEKYDNGSSSTGVGVYIESLATLGALPDVNYASGDASNFISYSSIRASTSNPSGTQIAVTGDDRAVKLYNLGDYTTAATSTSLGVRGSSITYSNDEETLYVGGLALSGSVVALNSTDLSENWSVDITDKPLALLPEYSGGVIAVLTSGNSVYWLPKNGNEESIINIELATQASAAAIDSRGKTLVVADTNQAIEVISLETGQRAHISHGAAVQAVAIDGFGTVWAVSQGRLKGYRLPDDFE